MTFVGHETVRRLLEQELPAVTLLRGPRSVGKWALALHLAAHHTVGKVDQLIIADKLTIDAVRGIVAFVSTAPFGRFKLILSNLDDASEAALNALLKTLEEPPATARFLLVAAHRVPPTIVSRAQTFGLGLLTDDQVRRILIAQGMTATAAGRAALHGRGRIEPAMRGAGLETRRAAVVTLMQAVATWDHELFDRTIRSWDDETNELLFRWFVEAITREYHTFLEKEFFGLTKDPARLRAMLMRLAQVPSAQSRLGTQVALEPFLTPR